MYGVIRISVLVGTGPIERALLGLFDQVTAPVSVGTGLIESNIFILGMGGRTFLFSLL